jgi:tetratricopeptide (TPR) repeat protein
MTSTSIWEFHRIPILKHNHFAKKACLALAAVSVLIIGAAPARVGAQTQRSSVEMTEVARDELNKGVSAFLHANYEEAIQYFKQSVELDPSSTTSELYLATAYAKVYGSKSASEQNKQYKDLAIQAFSKVLEKEPANMTAVAGLSSIYIGDNQIRNARQLFLRSTEIDPRNAVSQFELGSIDLAMVIGSNTDVSSEERSELVEEGLQRLKQALALNPDYSQAMSTLSVLYSQKAAMANTQEERSTLEKEASSWLAKSLTPRK